MARPIPSRDYAPYQDNYISLAAGETAQEALTNHAKDLLAFYTSLPEEKADYAYAAGKWTIKDVLQHVIDSERIFSYRVLRIARHDETPLPGFEEKDYAATANASKRTLDSLKEEFKLLRASTDALILSLSEEQLQRRGTTSGISVAANTYAFIIYGHLLHHKHVIEERYF
jgi:uncharacterized damage-inducible protein DinB